MNRPYRVGETVLVNYNGWLKAARVVKVEIVDENSVEYTMEPLMRAEWQKPVGLE